MKFSFLFCISLLTALFTSACSSSPEVVQAPATPESAIVQVDPTEQPTQIVEESSNTEAVLPAETESESEIAEEEIPVFNPYSESESAPSSVVQDEDSDSDLIRCDTNIKYHEEAYSASAVGPTLEEALDNGTEEACAIPCSDLIPETASDAERESILDECIIQCSSEAVNMSAQCWQHGESIFVEGEWSNNSETNDED